VLLACLAAASMPLGAAPPDDPRTSVLEDQRLLQKAGIGIDEPGLLAFFRDHTLAAGQHERITLLIRRLGDNEFAVREKASRDLITVGRRAVPLLRRALGDEDEEIKYRAREVLAALDRNSGAALAEAAARLLRVRRPLGAVSILLAYLPNAHDANAEDEVLTTLALLGVVNGKIDPALAAAIRGHESIQRAAGALVLGRSGTAEQREAVKRLFGDGDPEVRYRAAQGLLAARDPAAVPALVDLLSSETPGVAERAHDLLHCIAATRVPPSFPGEGATDRRRWRDAWASWWRSHGSGTDLAKADVDLPVNNLTLQARRLVRNFLAAMFTRDVTLMKKSLDLPFALAGVKLITKEEEVDQFLTEVLRSPVSRYSIQVGRLAPLSEYARMAPDEEKEIVARLNSPDNRVLYARVRYDDQEEDVAVFVRLQRGRLRVIGVGEGNGEPPGPLRP
jgi:HEAT repeat protein